MNIDRVIGRALVAGIALSAFALGPATVAQALPNNTGHATDCVYNGAFYPHGSAHPTLTDTFCDNGVWKTTLTTPDPTPSRTWGAVPKVVLSPAMR